MQINNADIGDPPDKMHGHLLIKGKRIPTID